MKTNRIISSSSFGNSNSFGSSFVLLFAAALVQLLSLSACSKDKEEYFNPDGTLIKHPGQVTINLDGVPQDHTATIALASANGTPYTLQSATPTYVEAGSYTITIVSHPTTSTLPQQLEILHARPAEGGSNIASGTGLLRITPDDDGTFTLSLRLLGIDPSLPQRLRLTLTYRDPSAAPYTYEADITSLLTDFNTGPANQPAHLNATLSFGLGDITTTITNWTPGTDQDITGQ